MKGCTQSGSGLAVRSTDPAIGIGQQCQHWSMLRGGFRADPSSTSTTRSNFSVLSTASLRELRSIRGGRLGISCSRSTSGKSADLFSMGSRTSGRMLLASMPLWQPPILPLDIDPNMLVPSWESGLSFEPGFRSCRTTSPNTGRGAHAAVFCGRKRQRCASADEHNKFEFGLNYYLIDGLKASSARPAIQHSQERAIQLARQVPRRLRRHKEYPRSCSYTSIRNGQDHEGMNMRFVYCPDLKTNPIRKCLHK